MGPNTSSVSGHVAIDFPGSSRYPGVGNWGLEPYLWDEGGPYPSRVELGDQEKEKLSNLQTHS